MEARLGQMIGPRAAPASAAALNYWDGRGL